MLHRSLSRSLRQRPSISSEVTCTLCKCTCGRRFWPDGPNTVQKRSYEPRKNIQSPYLYAVNKDKIQQEEKERKKHEEEREATRHYEELVQAHAAGELEANVDNALDFLNAFTNASRRAAKGNVVGIEEKAMLSLFRAHSIETEDVFKISLMLLRDEDTDMKQLGREMIHTLVRCHYPKAIVYLILGVLSDAKTRPSVLQSPTMDSAWRVLREWAEDDQLPEDHLWGFAPKILQGKVLYAFGKHDQAIQWWRAGLNGAVAFAHNAKPRPLEVINAADESLKTPWVELTNAYLAKRDFENAKWAADIGCGLDDPNSHYSAALLETTRNEYGDHVATSVWLYHITKAASSGHIKAAHMLGNWYGSSGWKYIEDEPPGSIKPTPFDSYPPDGFSQEQPSNRWWGHISTAVGLNPPSKDDLQKQLFLTAAFPDTAYGRFNLAIQWLEASMGAMYAPSYLLAARLLLEKTLWHAADAPRNAIELQSDRYTYASKADYDAGIPIERTPGHGENDVQDIPNPGYDPSRAKDLVREVLYAVQALQYMKRARKEYDKQHKDYFDKRDIEEDELFQEFGFPRKWPDNIKKWFRYPETREMYMDEQRNILYDHELKLDLDVTARQICDERGWDMYDDEGGLMYRCV